MGAICSYPNTEKRKEKLIKSNKRKKPFQEEELIKRKRDLELLSSKNLSLIEDYKVQGCQLDIKIKKKEIEIKKNKYQLRKDQLYEMANDLISVIKDRKRIQKNIRRIRAFNERIKDNIAVIDGIIQNNSNIGALGNMTDILRNMPDNEEEKINDNIVYLDKQKKNDERIINHLESANENDLDFDVKDYLNNLLGDSNCGPLPQYPYDQNFEF